MMSESYHVTAAPPEPTIYPEYAEHWAREGRAAAAVTIEEFGLRAAILTACDRLESATEEYAVVALDLATAVNEEAEARQALTWHETIARDVALTGGLPGSNEAARKAALDHLLQSDNVLAGLRSRLEEAQRARVLTESRCRVCGAAREDLRARMYALSSIVRGGGGL